MALQTAKKQRVIKKVQKHEKDTGSSEAQVAILTEEIKELATHLKKHKKDNHSRRGLIKKVADRRKHLRFLEQNDKKGYESVVKTLKLKK